MQAEYIAASEAAKEAVWLKNFLSGLEVVLEMDKPITFYCDNNGTVANSREPHSHKRGKHIERKYHLIKEIVHRGDVTITKISTQKNLANPLTMTLTEKQLNKHLEGMGPREMSHLL